MKENVDELTRLFNEGKHALDQFEQFHSALVPNRMHFAKKMAMKVECGFAAVNNGKHCIINGHCVVCKK